MAYQQQQPQHHTRAQPHFMTNTQSRSNHVSRPATSSASRSAALTVHSRPFYLSSNSRNKNFKQTFSTFAYDPTYEDSRSRNAFSRTQPLPSKGRELDIYGAPLQLHRGVTAPRQRTFEGGVMPSPAPTAHTSMNYVKDVEWQPAPYTDGGMKIGENFRQRGEGLEGMKRKQAKIERLHGQNGEFRHGADSHPRLFDPHPRTNSSNFSRDYPPVAQSIAEGRVGHKQPFRGSGLGAVVGPDRSYVGGERHQYHISPWGPTEREMNSGFRQECRHLYHGPFKSSRAAMVPGGTTDRNPNFHSVQAADETCTHRCNQVLQIAQATHS